MANGSPPSANPMKGAPTRRILQLISELEAEGLL
jgi:hypothetical protein